MRDSNGDIDSVHKPLKVFLEDVMTVVVAAATVAQEQYFGGVRIGALSVPTPPAKEAVAGEFAGVMVASQRDVTHVSSQIIETMGNDLAVGMARKIVIQRLEDAVGVQMA